MANPLNFAQTGFSGGMNLLLEPTRIAQNEYVYARNVRTRNDSLEPIKDHAIVATPDQIGTGLLQGLYAFGEWIIIFQDGEAYYTTYSTLGFWTKITGFLMSTSADTIYTCAVPIATVIFGRKADDASDPAEASLVSTITTGGSIAGLVCQDGATQPFFIYESGGVLVQVQLQDYTAWDDDPDNREYVPIGTKMVFVDGILYLVDSTETKLYRSVTGRPLDFVVNVTTAGAKGGDADTTAYAVSNSRITTLQQLNTTSLFVATQDGHSYAVTPNRDRTIFGEPTFDRVYLFKGGCLNQFSFVDILGDFGFIDTEGLRSFNAILQQNNEGRNSVFSQKIAAAFKDISQIASNTAAVVYDNYAIFSMRTKYGRSLVVYDTLYQTFVSFDSSLYSGVKQFAVVDNDGIKKLLAITEANTLFECYGGTNYAIASLQTREWSSEDPTVELRTKSLRAIFKRMPDEGEVTSTIYIDGATRQNNNMGTSKRVIPEGASGLLYVVTYPALWGSDRTIVNLIFNHLGGVGYKVGYKLRWDNGSPLTHIMSVNDILNAMSQAQSSRTTQYAS